MSLSSRERVLRAIRHEPVDCTPAAPYIYDVAAEAAGIKFKQFYTNPRAMAQAQVELQGRLGYDIISIGSDNYYIAEGLGCQTEHPEDALPFIKKAPLERLERVFELEPADPLKDGRMPVMLEAIAETRRQVGDGVAIRSPGTGPFALASYLIGSQNWLMEVLLDEHADRPPDGCAMDSRSPVQQAMALASETLIHFGKACWDAGADIIHCGDSLASCDVISPETYRRVVLPWHKKIFAEWKAYGVGTILLHICGNSTPVLEDYVQTGADLLEIDYKVDLAGARRVIGGRAAVLGNLDPVGCLLQGTPASVRVCAVDCISQAGPRGGYLLGSGCIVPRRTPLENLREMMTTAHRNTMEL